MNKISFHDIEAKSYESPKKQFVTIERSVTKALDLRNDRTNRPFEMFLSFYESCWPIERVINDGQVRTEYR